VLPGWTIFIDTDADNVLDEGEKFSNTDFNGNYLLSDLIPGNYTLAEVQQEGWISSHVPSTVTVLPNQVVGDADFGNYALPTLPGDFNRNGEVDAADYVLWRHTEGSSTPAYMGADGTGDGAVAAGDYDVWSAHFGDTESPSSEMTVAALGTGSGIANEKDETATPIVTQSISTSQLSAVISSASQSPRNRRSALVDRTGEFEQSRDEALLRWLSAGFGRGLSLNRDSFDEIPSDCSTADAVDDAMLISDGLDLRLETGWL